MYALFQHKSQSLGCVGFKIHTSSQCTRSGIILQCFWFCLRAKRSFFFKSLIWNFLFSKTCKTLKKIWNSNVFNIFFYAPKIGKTVFDMNKRKLIFLSFSSFSAFEKFKKYVPPCRRLKTRLQFFLALILEKQSTFFEALWQVKKQLKMWNFDVGSYNNLAQHGSVSEYHSILLSGYVNLEF